LFIHKIYANLLFLNGKDSYETDSRHTDELRICSRYI